MKSVRELHDELSGELLSVSNRVCARAGSLAISPKYRSELRILDEKISELCDALSEEIPISTQRTVKIFSIRIRSSISELNNYINQMSQLDGEVAELKSLMNFPKKFLDPKLAQNFQVTTLTKREREILALLPKGATAKAMASELYLTEATIKTHLASIYRKFEVVNRTQAIAIALENKLISF